jgi:ABC-type branched-subunit amino acid transport system ATPase component
MIHQARFRNFKGLRHVDVELDRFTVLVGPNASGKTSILEGLNYLSCLRQTSPAEFFQGTRDPSFLHTRAAIGDTELGVSSQQGTLRLRISPQVEASEGGAGTPPSDSGQWRWTFFFEKPANGQKEVWEGIPETSEVNRLLPSSRLLRLDPVRLAEPSSSEDQYPEIQPNGAGLASTLAYMKLNRGDAEFQRLVKAVQTVIPSVRGIRFDRVLVVRSEVTNVTQTQTGWRRTEQIERPNWGDALVFDLDGAPSVPAFLMSEGTLLVVGLLAVLMGPFRPHLILLDDLEQGLHPKAQKDLVRLLHKLLEENPELQILATAHSPYLLDGLSPHEIRLTSRNADGSVACARLDEHPEFEKWKEEMTPGEFWSMVGEKWVSERQPAESR